MPLYKDAAFSLEHIAFCALASVADPIIVLLMYFGFAIVHRDPLWIERATIPRIILFVLVGATGATIAEMRHLSSGNWAYDISMPIKPVVDVGLSPVLQFYVITCP